MDKNKETKENKSIEEIESHILKRYDLINKQGTLIYFNNKNR